jgi:hypothetical protein
MVLCLLIEEEFDQFDKKNQLQQKLSLLLSTYVYLLFIQSNYSFLLIYQNQ